MPSVAVRPRTLVFAFLPLLVLVVSRPLPAVARSDPYFTRTRSEANVFVEPVDSGIQKVAIMPFKAPTELIGSSVADLFVTEILKSGKYTLVERSQMAKVLGESELALAGLSTAEAVQLGSMVGADGVIIGTVVEYGTVAARGHAYPVVAVSVRLIDCQSGQVVWSADLSEKADQKSITLAEHAGNIVHEIVAGLYQKWIRQRGGERRASAATETPPASRAAASAESRADPPRAAEPAFPAAPAGFCISDLGLREVVLKWDEPGERARSYEIQRAASAYGTFDLIAQVDPAGLEYRDVGKQGAPLADGTTYYYRLVAVDGNGRKSQPTQVLESMTAAPPDPPAALRAEAHDLRAARLTWNASASEGVEQYVVERADAAAPERFADVATVGETTFSEGGTADSPLKDSSQYLYRVKSINRVGAVGVASEPVKVVTRPPPTVVAGLKAASDGLRCVPLSWRPSPADEQVVQYVVYRSDAEGQPFKKIATVEAGGPAEYLDGGSDPGDLADAHTYAHRVVAVNKVGAAGAPPQAVSATTRGIPPAVEGLRAEAGRARMVPLAWTVSSDEKVARYVIVRVGGGVKEFETIAEVQGRDSTSYADRGGRGETGEALGLKDGTEYAYSVAAVNIVGARSKWAKPVKVCTKPLPQTPAGLSATTNRPGAIDLSWSENPEKDIAAYTVEVSDGSEGAYALLAEVRDGTAVRETVPEPGRALHYRVRATDADGLISEWSAPVRGQSKPLPDAPSRLAIEYLSGNARLTWEPSPQKDVVTYRLWRQARGATPGVLGEAAEPAFVLGWQELRQPFDVIVTAVDRDGLESGRSEPLGVEECAPNVPEGVAASSGGLREVVVQWQVPGDNAVAYRVERASSPEGPFENAGQAKPIAGQYADPGPAGTRLADLATYFYRIVALATSGRESEPGDVVKGETAPPPAPPDSVRAEAPSSRAVRVEWSAPASEGITSYIVERAPAGSPDGFEKVGEVEETSFSEGGTPSSPLQDSTAYAYRVTAVNRVGSVGAPCEPVTVTTLPPPAPVRGLKAEGLQVRCVPLSWEASPEDDVAMYRISRAASADGPFEEITQVSGRENTTFLEGGSDPGKLDDDTTYCYRIKAENNVTAQSADSEVVSAVTRDKPPVVRGAMAESGRPREMPVSWNASDDEKVVGYVVARSDSEPGEYVEIGAVQGLEAAEFLDRGGARKPKGLGLLADGTEYFYKVLAFNTAGARSDWSQPFPGRTKHAPVVPAAPVASTDLPKSVRISWAGNAEPDIAEYVIEASARSGEKFRELARIPSDSAEGPTATEVKLDDGQKRYYRVKAIDADTLESNWSDEVEGNAKPLPHAPTNLRAEFVGDRARLAWDAAPETDIAEYKVYRKAMMVWKDVTTSSSTDCEIGPEAIGKGIAVAVTAVDADGLESAYSEPLKVVPASTR